MSSNTGDTSSEAVQTQSEEQNASTPTEDTNEVGEISCTFV